MGVKLPAFEFILFYLFPLLKLEGKRDFSSRFGFLLIFILGYSENILRTVSYNSTVFSSPLNVRLFINSAERILFSIASASYLCFDFMNKLNKPEPMWQPMRYFLVKMLFPR